MAPRQPEQDERLADWVDGRLSERDRERLEAEFGVNPELRAAAERYRLAVTKIRGELQAPDESIDLGDKIMASLASKDDVRPASRRLFPFAASFAAAAAILMTYFGLQYMPEFGGAESPRSLPKLASESEPLDEDERLVIDPSASLRSDDAPAETQVAGRGSVAGLAEKKLAEESRPVELDAPAKDVALGVRAESNLPRTVPVGEDAFAKAEKEETPSSIEQILRDALQAGMDEGIDQNLSRVAGLSSRELVLVVEVPQAAFANLRADLGAARGTRRTKPAAPSTIKTPARESRARQLERSGNEVLDFDSDVWRRAADQFMQQPLQQAQFQGLVAPPTVQGGYLDVSQLRDQTLGKAKAASETFAPLPDDVYFQVEGSEEQIFAYLKELKRISELSQGQVISQWTIPGVIQGLPIGGSLSVVDQVGNKNDQKKGQTGAGGLASSKLARKVNSPSQLPADQERAQTQYRQHFVLRQRK